MKAELVESDIYDNALDWSHGFARRVKRIFIPEYNLCITVDWDGANEMYVFTPTPRMREEWVVKDSIDVPARLVADSIEWARKKYSMVDEYASIMGCEPNPGEYRI